MAKIQKSITIDQDIEEKILELDKKENRGFSGTLNKVCREYFEMVKKNKQAK